MKPNEAAVAAQTHAANFILRPLSKPDSISTGTGKRQFAASKLSQC
jgi:hypothetical protein